MDKFRSTFPVAVTFVDGELPTAAKLGAFARQTRQGMSIIEYALGDLWNQSGDTFLHDLDAARLLIPSIGRYAGRTALLNPYIPKLSFDDGRINQSIDLYTHSFSNETPGIHEAKLPFPPAAGSTYTWVGDIDYPADAQKQATKNTVDSDGDWYIDSDTGNLYFFDALESAWTLTYKPSILGDSNSEATSNIIPDPDTDTGWNFQGLKIEYRNGLDNTSGYKIFLPPRGPLTNRVPEWMVSDNLSANKSATPDTGNLLYWQADDQLASTAVDYAEHYRYRLPRLLTEDWSDASAVPKGLMYLYDPNGTGTIIEGVSFTAGTGGDFNTYTLYASGSNLDTWLASATGSSLYSDTSLQDASHNFAFYPDGLRLVVVGQSLSDASSNTQKQLLNHEHGVLGAPIKHSSLMGLTIDTVLPSYPLLTPSAIPGDDHSMYLERHGYSDARDQYYNKMFGDIVFASKHADNQYENLELDSHAVCFGGRDEGGPGGKLFWENSTDRVVLEVDSNSATSKGLRIRDKDTPVTNYFDVNVNETTYVKISGGKPMMLDGPTVTLQDGLTGNRAVLDVNGLGLLQGTYRVTPVQKDISYSLNPIMWSSGGWEHETISPTIHGPGTHERTIQDWYGWTDPFDIHYGCPVAQSTDSYICFFIHDIPQDAWLNRIILYLNCPNEEGAGLKIYPFKHTIGTGDTGTSENIIDPGDSFAYYEWTNPGSSGYKVVSIPASTGFVTSSSLGFKRGTDAGDSDLTILKLVIGANDVAGSTFYKMRPYCVLRWTLATVSPWM